MKDEINAKEQLINKSARVRRLVSKREASEVNRNRAEESLLTSEERYCEDITDHRVLHEKSQKQAEELNRRNKDLEILNTITQAVHQSFDLEEVYRVALDMTIALENIDMAMIYLVDDDG